MDSKGYDVIKKLSIWPYTTYQSQKLIDASSNSTDTLLSYMSDRADSNSPVKPRILGF
jgi:hypothetical protein